MSDSDLIPDPPSRLTERALPPYSYVPGRFPHPIRETNGHMFGAEQHALAAGDLGTIRSTHHWAIDLFNHGYYWEAHEGWEAVWHAFQRTGPKADFVKGFIKLSAAGVKAREGNANGVERHVRRALELFGNAAKSSESRSSWAKAFGVTPAQILAIDEISPVIDTSHDTVRRVMRFNIATDDRLGRSKT